MSEKKPKVPETKAKEPNFIRFSKVQKNYLNEILSRQREKFNEAVGLVYEELGITEKISKAPSGTYNLRQDCSGLDVLAVPVKLSGKDN